MQVFVLTAAPLLVLEWLARRERQGRYFTSLAASVTFICFILDLHLLGHIFNASPSPSAFLAWALFGLIMAYGYDLELLLAASITSLMGYLAVSVDTWGGLYWLSFGERPEDILMAGLAVFAVGLLPGQRRGFDNVFRLYDLIAALLCRACDESRGRTELPAAGQPEDRDRL